MHVSVRVALFLILIGTPTQWLRADATEDLNAALKEATAAQNEAAANAPDQPTVKGREDALDRAIKANEAFKSDPNKANAENAADKKALEDAEKTALQQADGARGMARDKNQAERYRAALARRRRAHKQLEKVRDTLRGMLGGAVNRPQIEQLAARARRAQNELNAPIPAPGTPVSRLVSDGKVSVDFAGTGETIGHIADFTLKNLTAETLAVAIRPMILESRSGKNQHYACPNEQMVALAPNETKTVPMDGVCLVRNKPPVAKNVTGDLAINDGNAQNPRDPTCKISTDNATKMLRISTGIYKAADTLLADGALKEIPYSDPKKKKDIVVQWSTWVNPEISELTGAPPATKEDLKKVVYKQVEEKGPMTTETKKKVDQGIDTIFEKVELTSAKAKSLEEPSELASGTGSTIDIADTQGGRDGTPAPTQDRKKKPYIKLNWPQPVQDWIDQKKRANTADRNKRMSQDEYARKRGEFFDQSRYHRELEQKRKAAEERAKDPKATNEDKDNFDKADRELKELERKLEQDFIKTKEGERAGKNLRDAERAADAAHAREADASKNIDPATKAYVEEQVDWSEPVEGVW